MNNFIETKLDIVRYISFSNFCLPFVIRWSALVYLLPHVYNIISYKKSLKKYENFKILEMSKNVIIDNDHISYMWSHNFIRFALSLTISEIFEIFLRCFNFHKKNTFWKVSKMFALMSDNACDPKCSFVTLYL